MKVDPVSSNSFLKDIASLKGSKSIHEMKSEVEELKKNENVEFGLTNAERAMFANLFPDHVKLINGYNSYNAKGVKFDVEPGQLINRKV